MKALTALLLTLAAIMGGVLAYRTYSPAALHGTALDTPHALSRVTLLRDDDRAVNLADSGGKRRLIFFGYTRCPDICPATLGVLARAWDTLNAEQKAKLEVQLISVDPNFDRPAVLRRYLDCVQQRLSRSDRQRRRHPRPPRNRCMCTPPNGAAPGTLIHGDGVALVDEQGRFVRVYDNAAVTAVTAGELTADLPKVLR